MMTHPGDDGDDMFDRKAAEAEAKAGARALAWLRDNRTADWERWHKAIVGLRALHLIVAAEAGTSDNSVQAWRDAMAGKLATKTYAEYESKAIGKELRSYMLKLMPAIEDVNRWYMGLNEWEQQRWKNPQTVYKHYPRKHLLKPSGAPLANKNRGGRPKKPKGMNPDTTRLMKLLLSVLAAGAAGTLTKERCLALLAELGQEGPDDGLEDLEFDDEENETEE